MKTTNRTIRSLERGHNDKENMTRFVQETKREAKTLAAVLLALNLPSYLDMFYDEEQQVKPHPLTVKATESFQKVLSEAVDVLLAGNAPADELAYSVIAQRDANINHMHLLSAYADRFTIYEYVLNRLEHRFSGKTLPKGYNDQDAADNLMIRLGNIKDNSARQSSIVQMIEQLPMRMTKKRFFQIISEGLNVYNGSEKKTVEDLVFMIRTAALIEEPEGMASDYAMLYQIANKLTEADYASLDADGFTALYQQTKAGLEELNRQMDLVMMLQELLNQLTALLYTADTEVLDLAFTDSMEQIKKTLVSYAATKTLDDETVLGFSKLEGVQEQVSNTFFEMSVAAEEFSRAYESDIETYEMGHDFVVLERLNRLLSSSRFASLTMEEQGEPELADEAYLMGVFSALYRDLNEQFRKLPRMMNRAVMAKILTMFPLFIREYQELEAYVSNSLSSCTDVAEKIACMEIMDDLLVE